MHACGIHSQHLLQHLTKSSTMLLPCHGACLGDRKAAAPFPDGSGNNAHDPYWATVSEVRELHMPASERSCVHVELDISGNTQLTYQTGVTGGSSGGGG